MIEKTLVILKPDTVLRGITGEILSRFERIGLKLVAMKMLNAKKEQLEKHYFKDDAWKEKVGKGIIKNKGLPENANPIKVGHEIVEGLIEDMMISPVIVMVLVGHNAIKVVKKLVGPTNIEEALPGTIRGDYSHDTIHLANNLNRPIITILHATDDPKDAEKEINVWFTKDEIYSYKKPEDEIHYRKR